MRRSGALVCVLLCSVSVVAQPARPLESEVHAVCLLNFGRFANWPVDEAAESDAFTVCVLGRDPVGAVLDSAVDGERIDGRPVEARRIDKADEALRCRLLFIRASETARVTQILQRLSHARTLTVSDMPSFAERDGMIQFVREGNKVRFIVNIAAAEQAGLSFSSELLRVAASVIKGRER